VNSQVFYNLFGSAVFGLLVTGLAILISRGQYLVFFLIVTGWNYITVFGNSDDKEVL